MIKVNSCTFFDDYSYGAARNGPMLPNSGSKILMGSIGDVMYAEIEFEVTWSTTGVPMTFTSTSVTINPCGTTTGTTGSFALDGFSAEDTFVVENTGTAMDGQTYTIESIQNATINITGVFGNPGSYSDVDIYGTTPVNTLNLSYNLTPNPTGYSANENFVSLTDVVNQTLSVNLPNTTLSPITNQSAGWFDGPPLPDVWNSYNTITSGTPTVPYAQAFVANIMFTVKPLFLAGQLNSLIGGIPPSYFINSTLSFVYRINAIYNTTVNSANQTSDPQTFTVGNVGWFDQFLNNNPPNYSLASIFYTDQATGNVQNSIDWLNPTDVSILINSAHGSFTGSPSRTQVAVNFAWLPSSKSSYQNVDTNYQETMLWDHAHVEVGLESSPSQRGWLCASQYQIIDYVTVTELNANQIQVNFTTNCGPTAQNILQNSTGSYMIWVTPQAGDVVSLPATDRTAVLCDVNNTFADLDDPTQLTVITSTPDYSSTKDILVFKYPQINSEPYTNFAGASGDYTFARCDFSIPIGSQLTSCNASVNAVTYDTTISNPFEAVINTTQLENWNNNLSAAWNGSITQVNVVNTRNFPFSSAIVPLFQELDYVVESPISSANFYTLYSNVVPRTLQIQYTISSVNYVANDDGNGNITGTDINPTGSFVNYITGNVNINYNTSPDTSSQIRSGYSSNDMDFRNVRALYRVPQLDTSDTYALRLIYGFQAGFNYNQSVQSTDPSLANVRTQDWSMYYSGETTPGPDQSVKLELDLVWNVTSSTGVATQFEQTMPIFVGNQRQNQSGYECTILTYDIFGNPLGTDSFGNPVFANDQNTLVVATFTGSGIDHPPVYSPALPYNGLAVELSVFYRTKSTKKFDTASNLYPLLDNTLWVTQPQIDTTSPGVQVSALINVGSNVTGARAFAKLDYITTN